MISLLEKQNKILEKRIASPKAKCILEVGAFTNAIFQIG